MGKRMLLVVLMLVAGGVSAGDAKSCFERTVKERGGQLAALPFVGGCFKEELDEKAPKWPSWFNAVSVASILGQMNDLGVQATRRELQQSEYTSRMQSLITKLQVEVASGAKANSAQTADGMSSAQRLILEATQSFVEGYSNGSRANRALVAPSAPAIPVMPPMPTTIRRIGETTYETLPDGQMRTWQTIGDAMYSSDGIVCRKIGETVTCQ